MPTPSVGLISPTQFDQYTSQWLSVVSESTSTELDHCFVTSDSARVLLISLTSNSLTELLSTVGIEYVKVRFLLIPTAGVNTSRFALALFATNGEGERLSAYYLADEYATQTPESPTQSGGVPTTLAAAWLKGWRQASLITPAMFATPSLTPLRGYNFGVRDFMDPLSAATSLEDINFQLSFGLHEYYSAGSDEVITQTFGLLLRAYNPQQPAEGEFYDLATPCPPVT